MQVYAQGPWLFARGHFQNLEVFICNSPLHSCHPRQHTTLLLPFLRPAPNLSCQSGEKEFYMTQCHYASDIPLILLCNGSKPKNRQPIRPETVKWSEARHSVKKVIIQSLTQIVVDHEQSSQNSAFFNQHLLKCDSLVGPSIGYLKSMFTEGPVQATGFKQQRLIHTIRGNI